MIVADLIAELQKMPSHAPVKIVLSMVYDIDELGEREINLTPEDAIEADRVSWQGGYVLVESK